jgi:hypothetical protein
MELNRNIITAKDLDNQSAALDGRSSTMPVTFDRRPPANPTGTRSADDYLTKLLKYVPPEVIGFYLFTVSIVADRVQGTKLQLWLLALLLCSILGTVLYSRKVLSVRRKSQMCMGALGFSVYAFAIGGWFATMTWYESWFGSIALATFAIMVRLVNLPELPTQPVDPQPANPPVTENLQTQPVS